MPFDYLIRELERSDDISWCGANGINHRGPVVIFEATKGERWLRLIVESEKDLSISTVRLAVARPESDEILQITRKTDLYQLSDLIPGMLYHPIGIATINSSGRLRRVRITADDVAMDVSLQSILKKLKSSGIQIKKYEEVTSKSSRQLKGKLCVAVPMGDFESIVVAFIGEKIVPLIG